MADCILESETATPWHGRRVLITGAAGFIGSHLSEMLVRAGARVRAFDQYNSAGSWGQLELLPADVLGQVEVVLGDVRDAAAVAQAVRDCDWVFHLAALIGIPYSYTAPDSYVQTNVAGTLNVLQACRAHERGRPFGPLAATCVRNRVRMARTHAARGKERVLTGAFGLTTKRASEGSSNSRFSVPSENSTSNPS